MSVIRQIIGITTMMIISVCGYPQTQSDVGISEGGYGMVKTNINVSYDHNFGNITDGFGARVSYELFKNKKFTITANAKYTSATTDFQEGDLSVGFIANNIDLNGTHVMGQIGATVSYKHKLFGRPFMGLAMVGSDWGDGGFERVSATMMGLFMLRANRNTQFGIGPMVMINTCSKLPAFLVFMYRHKFNDKWLLNLYGGMFGVDYMPTKDDLLCVGADIDVKAFYFKPKSEMLPTKCRLTKTSFCPMVKYRRRLASNLYIEAKAGYSLKMSCRVNGVTGTKEYFECSDKASPFLMAAFAYSL